MTTKESNYKSIFKATSIFGGVQVFNILITLIRGKAVAILLGTAGMGLNGLFLTSLNLIKTISSLGISESGVRDVSRAHASGDRRQLGLTLTVFRRWVWITGAIGVALTILFSPLLSRFSFNSTEHTTSYIWLSSTFLFAALMGETYTFLRGTGQIKSLASANIFGSVAGLVVALPIFYFYGIDGVVPAIIASAFAAYLVSLYFKKKVQFDVAVINWKETFVLGKPMVQLGISLTLINLLAAAVTFVLSAFISKTGSLSDLGLYNAGLSIVDGYVGMVFTAMATDYFPRLSAVINEEGKWKQLVNEQAELVLIILTMVLVLLISTIPLLIRLLLSKEFTGAQDFIVWSVLAIPLKGLVWVLGFVILAKGNNKLFLIVEVIANLIVLSFNLIFYHYYAITGLGISMVVSFTISLVLIISVLKSRYNFSFSKDVIKLVSIALLSLALCLISIKLMGYPNAYYAEILIVICTFIYSLHQLNKRINLKTIIDNLKAKVRK